MAVVVKYADNLYKAFAVSISIVLSSLISVPLFNFSIRSTLNFFSSINLNYMFGDSFGDSICSLKVYS